MNGNATTRQKTRVAYTSLVRARLQPAPFILYSICWSSYGIRELHMGSDVLSIVEAAYADATDERAWAASVLSAAEPCLDRGLGLCIARYNSAREDVIEHVACTGPLREPLAKLWSDLRGAAEQVAADQVATGDRSRFFPRHPAVAAFASLLGVGARWRSAPAFARLFASTPSLSAIGDMVGIMGGNPSGDGVMLISFTRGAARLGHGATPMWIRVAAHLAAGYRLVRARQPSPVDAIVEAGGRIQHVEEPLPRSDRASLSDSARALDRARGQLRRTDPQRALAIWKGLVSGRWTLVDHVDHDGRRYLFAKRNSPPVRSWRTLTEREAQVIAYAALGQSHKEIAYQLGISPSRVSTHLAGAARKVGVRSRLQLVSAYREASQSPEGEEDG